MRSEVLRFDTHDGVVSVHWQSVFAQMPDTPEKLAEQPISSFAFTHSCGGVMNLAAPGRQVLFCRFCGARVLLGNTVTLQDLLNQRWPIVAISTILDPAPEPPAEDTPRPT